MTDHFLGQIYRKKNKKKNTVNLHDQQFKNCSDAQMTKNTTRIIIINMYGFEKIKRVMRIAVAIIVLFVLW